MRELSLDDIAVHFLVGCRAVSKVATYAGVCSVVGDEAAHRTARPTDTLNVPRETCHRRTARTKGDSQSVMCRKSVSVERHNGALVVIIILSLIVNGMFHVKHEAVWSPVPCAERPMLTWSIWL